MIKLSIDEQDLLQRVDKKTELRPLFFSKVKGLKWFDALQERGYFDPEKNPKPTPSEEEGYVKIPFWPALDYLVKTASELAHPENDTYSKKFLDILVTVTNHSKIESVSNYRTWWQFAEILTKIPHEFISVETLDIIDYWLDDKYETDLTAREIGEKWLPSLLQENDQHALDLSKRIIEILYKPVFHKKKYGRDGMREAFLRFDYHYAQKITECTAAISGEKLGLQALGIFHKHLKHLLSSLTSDSWSSVWHPAIEDHDQNKHREQAENILIFAYRDSLNAYIKANPETAPGYIDGLIKNKYKTIKRLAIHAITKNNYLFLSFFDRLLKKNYLTSDYQHEIWHFLNKCYPSFSQIQKHKAIRLILRVERHDDKKSHNKIASAYQRAIWLSAVKDHGKKESELYFENVRLAKAEPDHPDFSFYITSVWGGQESPISLDELQGLSIDSLVQYLANYQDPGKASQSDLEGLASSFETLIKTEPLKFYLDLNQFIDLPLPFLYGILEGYRDLWSEKAKLPWDLIWNKLFEFCFAFIHHESFLAPQNAKLRGPFVANRHWLVSSIGRLIEAGTKSDDHAFSEELLENAEAILAILLNDEPGSEIKKESDAVSVAINSPRGHCLEALINLALRSCRIADKASKNGHSEIWARFQHYFDSELDRGDSANCEYEFATLVTLYLPNFLYMSRGWVHKNLNRIFDQRNYLKWLCAMQGYSYTGTVYQEIYRHLKSKGDFLKALNDENIKDRVNEKVIQNIVIAYVNDFENFDDDDSLIKELIIRNNCREINYLIWFVWSLRDKAVKLKNIVYELWPKILQNTDLSSRDGRKVASQLSHWARFVDIVDEDRMALLRTIAPFSGESHNSYDLLRSIAQISEKQPLQAYEILMAMLEGSQPDYPEDAVRKIFRSLVELGPGGLRKAKEIESAYLKVGNDRPSIWLREISERSCNSE